MNKIHIIEGLAKAQLEIAVFKDGIYHIAYSPALDLAGQGANPTEAIDSLSKIVQITLDWATEKNALHALLLEHGWTLQEKPFPSYSPPIFNQEQVKKSLSINQFETQRIPIYA